MEMIKRILRVCYYIIWGIAIAALAIAVPILRGYYPMTIMVKGLEPGYTLGSLSYYKEVPLSEIQPEDVILFESDGRPMIRRVATRDQEDEHIYVRLDERTEDYSYQIGNDQIMGKLVHFSIPVLGMIPNMITHWYVAGGMCMILLANISTKEKEKPKSEKKSQAAEFFGDL